jgi:sporulation protein YunB
MFMRRKSNISWILLLLFVICLVAFFVFRSRFRPVIQSLAETQLKNTTSDLINDAISEQIATGEVRYDRIVYFEKDINGRITALKTNISEVNRLKTDILNLINDEILALDTADLGVPLGSLFLPELFSGKGPQIPVQVLSIRNSDASFHSEFSQAGINQTLQRLLMEVSVDVTILVMGDTESYTVATQVVVAETIIVGDVPDTYFQTGGNNGY